MIRQPVLIYNGMDDLHDFKDAAQYLADGLPRSRRDVFPGLGKSVGSKLPGRKFSRGIQSGKTC